MSDEAARQGRPATTTSAAVETTNAAGRELSVEEIVAGCREVAAGAGLTWLHEVVVEELERLRAAA